MSKLAHLMEVDEATLRAQLLVLKKHTVIKTHAGSGDLTQGEAQPTGDVQFFIDLDPTSGDEMVHVAEAAPPKRRGALGCCGCRTCVCFGIAMLCSSSLWGQHT